MDNNFHRNHIKENDTIKEIISKYDDILNNKSIINEDLNLLNIGIYITESPQSVDTSKYSYIDFKDRIVGSSTPSKDKINPSLLSDVNQAAKIAGVKASVTTAVTGHKRGTRHESGLAVDLAMFDGKGYGSKNAAIKTGIYDKIEKFVRALESMGYKVNSERGHDKAVLWFGFLNHHHHVHVSRKSDDGTSTSSSSSSEIEKKLTSKKGLPKDIEFAISKLKLKYGINITKIEIDKEFKQEGNWVSDNKSVDKTAETKINELIKDCKKKFPKISTGIISGYRSYDDQVDNFGSKAKSRGIEDTQKSNTLPGFSQHHTGKAFDIFSVDTSWWNSNKDVKKWVEDNAKKYGFKVTYTELGKLRIPEPWHLYYDNNKSTTTTDNTTTDNITTDNTTDNTTTGDSKDKLDLLGNETGDNKINDLLGFLNYFKPGAVSEDLINKKNKIHEDVFRIKDIMKKIL